MSFNFYIWFEKAQFVPFDPIGSSKEAATIKEGMVHLIKYLVRARWKYLREEQNDR